MKKIKVVALGLAMAVAMTFVGCNKNKEVVSSGKVSADQPGWKANAENPVKFDWYINFSWFARHWGDSIVSKYITEKTGVDVNFIVPHIR